jgi:hypothetical protein
VSEATTTDAEPMAYIARKACGCFVYAGADTTDHRVVVRDVAWYINRGYAVDRVTCQYVRENWRSSCAVCEPPAVAQQEAMQL